METTEKVNLYNSYDENTYPEQDFQVIAHDEREAVKLLNESGLNTEVIILVEAKENIVNHNGKPEKPKVIKLKRRKL